MFKQYCIIEKVLVISIFVGKIRLTFHYKKMSEKMYGKLLEKHKNSVFHISKIDKVFSHFDFNSTIRKKIHLIAELFGNMKFCKMKFLYCHHVSNKILLI